LDWRSKGSSRVYISLRNFEKIEVNSEENSIFSKGIKRFRSTSSKYIIEYGYNLGIKYDVSVHAKMNAATRAASADQSIEITHTALENENPTALPM
jgi:hypothetical protein